MLHYLAWVVLVFYPKQGSGYYIFFCDKVLLHLASYTTVCDIHKSHKKRQIVLPEQASRFKDIAFHSSNDLQSRSHLTATYCLILIYLHSYLWRSCRNVLEIFESFFFIKYDFQSLSSDWAKLYTVKSRK